MRIFYFVCIYFSLSRASLIKVVFPNEVFTVFRLISNITTLINYFIFSPTGYINLLSRQCGMDYSPDQSNPSIEECHKRLQTLIRNEKNGQDWFQLFFYKFFIFFISSPLYSCDYYYTIFCFAFFIFCCFCEVFAVGCALFFSVFEYFFGYIKLKIWNIYSSNKLLVIQFIWLMCYKSCNSLFSQP